MTKDERSHQLLSCRELPAKEAGYTLDAETAKSGSSQDEQSGNPQSHSISINRNGFRATNGGLLLAALLAILIFTSFVLDIDLVRFIDMIS